MQSASYSASSLKPRTCRHSYKNQPLIMAYDFGPQNCTYDPDFYNATYQNFVDRLCRGVTIGRVNAASIILLLLTGLPWNALVIAVIVKKKLYTRPSVMLMLNLAVVNFLVCLLIMPFPIVLGILVKHSLERVSNKMVKKVCQTGILLALLPAASIYTVALMSVDRAIYLKKPLSYGQIVTPRRMFLSIVILWVLSTAISTPPLFSFDEVSFGIVKYSPDIATCTILTSSSSSQNTFYYFTLISLWMTLGTLVQLFSSGCIIYITRKFLLIKLHRALDLMRGHGRRSNKQSSSLMKDYNNSQLQLVKVFGAIFTASLLTVFPLVVLTFTEPFLGDNKLFPLQYLYPVAYISLLSKSVIHPILESYLTPETRDIISKVLSCKRARKNLAHSGSSCTEAGTDEGSLKAKNMLYEMCENKLCES